MNTTARTLAHAAMITMVAGASIAHAQAVTAPADAPAKQAPGKAPDSAPTTTPLTLSIGDPDRRFDLASARGRFLVVHPLDASKPASDVAAMVRRARTEHAHLAGVQDIYVVRSDKATFDAIVALLGADAPVYRDGDGALASALSLSREERVTAVLLGPQGTEVWRTSEPAPVAMHRSLSARVELLRKDPTLPHANLGKGVAIQGYDPVAYLNEARAVKGAESISTLYRGVTYRFGTAENRAAFNAEPEKYIPAYGGWCATAMAYGRKVEIDPTSFKVTNGRLLLFYKGIRGNALKDWNKDEPGQLIKADENWRSLTMAR